MQALKVTLLHSLELIVSLVAAYFILNFISVEGKPETLLLTLAINALAKYARASEKIGVPDYTRID